HIIASFHFGKNIIRTDDFILSIQFKEIPDRKAIEFLFNAFCCDLRKTIFIIVFCDLDSAFAK
ncbi:hypothetical protein, partial [Massilia sp. Mn16-1_5]|uniref:hypothetical protein n=1 Tax=Massilia sp. Mn16-1_5 TaxID=2079199 RepID=UPI001B351B3E